MNNAIDKVTINGDFNTCADYYYYHDSCLKLGTIEIKGDLNDYYNTNSKYYGLSSYGTKFIFSGTGRQIITALDGKLVLNTAEFVNKDVQIACSTEIDVDVPVKVHDYSNEWTIDEEADCVNDGSKSHHCTRCKAKKDITSIPATGHKYVETVVEPSYSNRGYTLYECSVCGYSYKDNYEEQLIVPAVTGFASGSQTKSSAVLGWDKVSDADGYAVELYTGGKWNEVFRTSDSSVTSCTVGSLKADSTYSLRIRAFKDTDDGTVYSDYTRLAVKTKLANVAGLKAQGVTATAVKLDWVRNAGATGYIIEQYKGGKWTQIAVTKNNYTLTFTVKGLAECTPYSFRVKAYKNDGGKTNYSDYVTVKASTLLGTVKNAKVTSTTGTWITLGWDRNTGATGYVLEQYKGGRWTEIAVTKNNTTLKFTVKGLRNDTTYSFRIKAYKTVGDTTTYGSYVRIVGTTDIPNVAKFTGSAVSASAVKLDWSKNDKATGYVIEQYKGGRWTEIKAVDNDITEITIEGLAKGTAYTFRIKSVKTVDGADKSSEYASVKVNTAE
jgi:pyruvoyl-dependent arginine decarboxylase (PvlArgDC)